MSARREAREHADIAALIPWYLNETLAEHDRRRVEEHLAACERCRRDLDAERQVLEAMSRDTAVEYMPAASLNRLRARLDGEATPAAPPARRLPALRPSRQGLMAASVALMAVALSYLAVDQWRQSHRAASYYTVTAAATRPSGEAIRAVFSPSITLAELQSLLDQAELRIVAGPTEAGVYSLAETRHGSVTASLARLRAHPKVRFAEGTRLDVRAGDASTGPSGDP